MGTGVRIGPGSEAPPGFEPGNEGFADLCLTTWLWRREQRVRPYMNPPSAGSRRGVSRLERSATRCCMAMGCTRRSTRPSAARCARWWRRSSSPSPASGRRGRSFPGELFTRFGELGFLGLKYPEAYGGSDAGELYEAVLLEEMGRCGSGGVAAGLGAQHTIATGPLHKFGTEEQKRRFLAPAIQGDPDRRARHHRARRRLGRGRAAHPRPPRGRPLCRQRLEDVHHQWGPGGLRRPRGENRARGAAPQGPVPPAGGTWHAGLQRGAQAAEARLARLGHRGALLRGLPGARRQPARGGGGAGLLRRYWATSSGSGWRSPSGRSGPWRRCWRW